MGSLVDQVLALLSSDAGSLMYHLVLAFSVAGTLQISLNQSQRYRSPQIRRVLLGVGLLLVLQLALFVASGLVWQAVVDGRIWLPLLERSVSLLSLVLIVWLWSFPNPDSGSNTPPARILSLPLIQPAYSSACWRWLAASLAQSGGSGKTFNQAIEWLDHRSGFPDRLHLCGGDRPIEPGHLATGFVGLWRMRWCCC